jgi:hypothetical protein
VLLQPNGLCDPVAAKVRWCPAFGVLEYPVMARFAIAGNDVTSNACQHVVHASLKR